MHSTDSLFWKMRWFAVDSMAYLNETELFYCNGNQKCRDEHISLTRNVDIDFKTICVGGRLRKRTIIHIL